MRWPELGPMSVHAQSGTSSSGPPLSSSSSSLSESPLSSSRFRLTGGPIPTGAAAFFLAPPPPPPRAVSRSRSSAFLERFGAQTTHLSFGHGRMFLSRRDRANLLVSSSPP